MPSSYLRDAARRRAARHGGSYQRALQALTRYDNPLPAGPLRNPAGIDWSPLYGLEVDLDNDVHQLRGVVLPPDGVRPGADILRVAVTSPARPGLAPAEVTYIDARRWTIRPMPEDADSRLRPSRRRTRGPRGLHLYRWDDLPATALATRTMLRSQHRARPGADQPPIAEYWSGQQYSDLYAIDDAVALAPLAPARQAAWLAGRTCHRCGQQDTRRYQSWHDGHHYCPACYPQAAEDWWETGLRAAQQASIDWARDLTADPAAVLITYAQNPRLVRLLVTEISSGATLHDHIARVPWWPDNDPLPTSEDQLDGNERADLRDALTVNDIAAVFESLRHRRILTSSDNGLHPVLSRLPLEMNRTHETGDGPWTARAGDNYNRRFGHWILQPGHWQSTRRRWGAAGNDTIYLSAYKPDRTGHRWAHRRDGVPARAATELRLLRRMAAGLPDAVITAQHASPHHQISVRPADLIALAHSQ